jgi:hypothetical protein
MYLILKPLTVSKVFSEKIENYCRSNESIVLDVITSGQNFFINNTGLFCHGNRNFDKEWAKNEELQCYTGQLVIYRKSKVKKEDLVKQKIEQSAIGKIQDLHSDNTLYFEIFLDDESFSAIDKELSIQDGNTRNIGVYFENPPDEKENSVNYENFSEYSLRNSHIKWQIVDKEKHNYLTINEVNFNFQRIDIEDQFYDIFTKEEREQTKRDNEDYRLRQVITSSIDNSNLNQQVNKLTAQVAELQSGYFVTLKRQIFILTTCIVFVTLKYLF